MLDSRNANHPGRSLPILREGTWTQLVPVDRSHYDELWQIAARDPEVWGWRGRPVSQETFVESLWFGVLTQFVIRSRETSELLGLVSAYDANLHHGFVYLRINLKPEHVGAGWPLEGLSLFVDHLFDHYGLLRKIYGHMSSNGSLRIPTHFLTHEATLTGHFVEGNETHDLLILSLTRGRWFDEVRERVLKLTGRKEEASLPTGARS